MKNYMVVIPVLNQLKYTKICVESLYASGTPPEKLLVINNGSVDETAAWLAAGNYRHINNQVNLGCGGAWTQGALLSGDADWVILLNNDVVLCNEFCERLISAAERQGLDIVSPAMVENELDYDFPAYSMDFVQTMGDVMRPGRAHGVCFAVRTAVFHDIGFPDTDRGLGGHEDLEFFLRAASAGKKLAIVGSAFLHHYGSITQKAMKAETGQKTLGQRHIFYRKVGFGWLRRKLWKRANSVRLERFVASELKAYGRTLHALRQHSAWTYL